MGTPLIDQSNAGVFKVRIPMVWRQRQLEQDEDTGWGLGGSGARCCLPCQFS